MVGADKFGNVCVVRIPQDMSRIVEDDPTGGKSAGMMGQLNSAPHKLEPIINFHAGDLIMSLQLSTLQQGGQEVRFTSSYPPAVPFQWRFHTFCDCTCRTAKQT